MRSVRVDRASTPRQVVDRVAPVQYIEESVLDAMPRGTRKDVAVYFFKPCLDLDDTDLAKQYLIRNLYPCDPFALAAVNEADPSFAMRYPNATHWKDDRGAWCVAAFSKSAGGIGVCVDRGCGWVPGWYFAGCMTPP
ncbi:MAG TPA: hypothetical protein VF803_00595 [Candidatus Paceibacterota bacterium]